MRVPTQTSGAASADTRPRHNQKDSRLWFDGPEYRELYGLLQNQDFDGYSSIDQVTVQPAYRIPDSAMNYMMQVLQGAALEGVPHAKTSLGSGHSTHYVGFDANELSVVMARPGGLTLGEAIQKLYMVRLREDNELLPMVEVYPHRDGLDDAKIKGTVWLGDVVDSVNFKLLRQREITALVSIHPQGFRSKGQEKHGKDGIAVATSPIRWHLRLELTDSKDSDMESEFESVFNFIHDHVTSGRNVLAHCIAGKSRSVAVVRDFIQRMDVERGLLDAEPGSAEDKYDRLKHAREAEFIRLKELRPGITEDNFKDQLDNSTRKLCGLPPAPKVEEAKAKAADSNHQEPVKDMAGGKLAEAVAMVFFFYRLRPSESVIKGFEIVRQYHSTKTSEESIKDRETFSFPEPLIRWFEKVKAEIQPQVE